MTKSPTWKDARDKALAMAKDPNYVPFRLLKELVDDLSGWVRCYSDDFDSKTGRIAYVGIYPVTMPDNACCRDDLVFEVFRGHGEEPELIKKADFESAKKILAETPADSPNAYIIIKE